MITREFVNARITGRASVWYQSVGPADLATCSAADYLQPFSFGWSLPRLSTSATFTTAKQARAGFDSKVISFMKKGWRETERSLSRRVYLHPDVTKPAKFWAVWLEGTDLVIQFGKFRRRSYDQFLGSNGQQKKKSFQTVIDAQAAMQKLIAEKKAGGYKELWPRPLVKKRAATTKRRAPRKV